MTQSLSENTQLLFWKLFNLGLETTFCAECDITNLGASLWVLNKVFMNGVWEFLTTERSLSPGGVLLQKAGDEALRPVEPLPCGPRPVARLPAPGPSSVQWWSTPRLGILYICNDCFNSKLKITITIFNNWKLINNFAKYLKDIFWGWKSVMVDLGHKIPQFLSFIHSRWPVSLAIMQQSKRQIYVRIPLNPVFGFELACWGCWAKTCKMCLCVLKSTTKAAQRKYARMKVVVWKPENYV